MLFCSHRDWLHQALDPLKYSAEWVGRRVASLLFLVIMLQ